MKVIFFDSKTYDKESFTKELVNYPDVEVKFLKTELTVNTAELAHGYDAVCAFVSADICGETIDILHECGVKFILLRCAGFNNVDMDTAKKYGIKVYRVPGYSPEAVAEHAMALALAVNRHLHIRCNLPFRRRILIQILIMILVSWSKRTVSRSQKDIR